MQGQKVPIKLPSGEACEGTLIQVEESSERWSEFTLSDGTVVRAKVAMTSAARADGHYDQMGNPLYLINMTPVVSIVSVPESLRKKVQ